MSNTTSIIDNFPDVVIGAEDDDEGTPNLEGSGNEGDPNAAEGSTGGENPGTGDEGEDGRTKALRAERKLKREAEAEAKRLRAENEALKRKDMEEVDRLKAELNDASSKNTESLTKLEKLTEGFKASAVKAAISAEASRQNFIDVNDALAGVDFSTLVIDQDEEDPSQVTIDLKTVTAAVKKLAASKPHYIKAGTDDGEPTGSTFGGSRKNNSGETSEDTLRNLYPSL